MLKPVIAAATVLAIAGASFAYAQQRFGRPDGYGPGVQSEHRHHLSAEDIAAFGDARIAALKAGLALNADQEKNWPPLDQALHDLVKLRVQRVQARQNADQQNPGSPFDRLARRADMMSQTGAALKRVADAGAPLYQSLNDAQKNRFTILARMLRPHPMHAQWRDGRSDGPAWQNGRRFGDSGGPWRHPMRDSSPDGGDANAKL